LAALAQRFSAGSATAGKRLRSSARSGQNRAAQTAVNGREANNK
jgi:hypothetical protein